MKTIKLLGGGVVVIPEELLKLLHIEPGDELLMEERDGSLVLTRKVERIRQLRDELQSPMPSPVKASLADEVIAERRIEVAQDQAETINIRFQ
jgi:bifunctional DNA-binding transcriptional regulator/antitoxin component of YhaV-PrlF toxin-antitoxin module